MGSGTYLGHAAQLKRPVQQVSIPMPRTMLISVMYLRSSGKLIRSPGLGQRIDCLHRLVEHSHRWLAVPASLLDDA